MKNEITEREAAGAVVAYDYSQDEGSGFENQTAADRTVPFLAVLQSNSPQVEDGPLKAGDLFNSASEETFPGADGIVFVPGITEHVFIEWIPRDQGGGFVARYELDDPFVAECRSRSKEFGKIQTPAGNNLTETFYVYGVICPEDRDPEVVVVSFTSTKIKAYRQYFGNKLGPFTLALDAQGKPVPADSDDAVGKVRPPIYAHSARITTFRTKNNKGAFYNFSVTPAVVLEDSLLGPIADSLISPDDPRFVAAKACRELVSSGAATAAVEPKDDAKGDDGPF